MDSPQRQPPSLSTIAAAAGCSVSTASRALRAHPSLKPETIRRVQEAAHRLGYRVNPLVSGVMRQIRGLGHHSWHGAIAYLTYGETSQAWRRHLTYTAFYEGARARAEELGFHVEEIWADEPGLTPARLGGILQSRGITGVVVGPTPGLPAPPRLDWGDFAAVKIGVPIPGLPLPCAVSNQFRAMQQVLERLRLLGYRRVGLVLQEHQNIKTSSLWLAPFSLYEQHIRPADRVAPLILDQWREAKFAAWFRRHRPEVVVGLRAELVRWLDHLNIRVPDQVGFVHLDRTTEPGSYAGIDQRPREIGAAAIDLVVSRLLANERNLQSTQRTVLIDGVWTDGPTVRPLRPTALGGA